MTTVALTGASGLIGRHLVPALTGGGYNVISLVRGEPGAAKKDAAGGFVIAERNWDPSAPAADLLDGVDAVIHLAGEPIVGRFNEEHKKQLMASRVGPTRRLAELSDGRPFISASAIGYYGHQRTEPVDEKARPGDDFLAAVCWNWEEAAQAAVGRNVQVRTGLVMSEEGGLLAAQLPLFKAGLGGPVGDGSQMMSWVALDDMVQIYLTALEDDRLSGPVNAVSPAPVSAMTWAKAVGHALRRPVLMRVPKFAPAALLGEQGARELALASQNVVPAALAAIDYQWQYTDIDEFLLDELRG